MLALLGKCTNCGMVSDNLSNEKHIAGDLYKAELDCSLDEEGGCGHIGETECVPVFCRKWSSYKTIAELYDITLRTVKSNIRKTKKSLFNFLSPTYEEGKK